MDEVIRLDEVVKVDGLVEGIRVVGEVKKINVA